MSLVTGARLGAYEVLGTLGVGGMGEVYRVRDTRLGRDVALKCLPDMFATDADRLARFTREAQTLATLNHPNIAHIHGFEEFPSTRRDLEGRPRQGRGAAASAQTPSTSSAHGVVRALVMELVEGEDLSVQIARGPMPIEEALPIARQIAEALEAAHDQGVIHRDLKPSNIKVRADGTVKVLDFGLAKALDRGSSGSPRSGEFEPTMTSPAVTAMGLIVGTAAYMAPEQARGKGVDKRADLWAFGVVLYEMLTGRRAFSGESVTDVLAAVVKDPPDWS
jgi:eukaryotic-like serine/threonine-protein kinase